MFGSTPIPQILTILFVVILQGIFNHPNYTILFLSLHVLVTEYNTEYNTETYFFLSLNVNFGSFFYKTTLQTILL